MFIGYRLKKLRKKRKLTQKALAEKVGISRSYLSDIENNKYNPSFDTIEGLSSALHLDLKSFFDDALLEEDYYLKPLKEELEEEIIEEVEELSDNHLAEKPIVSKELEIPYTTGSLSKKEVVNIKSDLEKTLNNLDNLERDITLEGVILDGETRKAFRESLENSMKLAKLIAKNKFSSKK